MNTSKAHNHATNAKENTDKALLSRCQEMLEPVADDDIPAMAFLLLDTSKIRSADPRASHHQELRDPFHIHHDKLRDAFYMTVEEQSTETLRINLTQHIAVLREKCQDKRKLKKSLYVKDTLSQFSTSLDEYDEALLRLHEVLLLFSCQVPDDIEDVFEKICRSKNVPAVADDGKIKEFFVNAKNKALREICKALSEEAVCQMYDNLMRKTDNDFYAKTSAKRLMLLKVSLSDMENIKGLKEAAFYCFILALFKEGLLSRIHTHSLEEYLQQVETIDLSSVLRRYPLASNPPGLCIIFNMEEGRKGAELDYERTENLFKNTFKYDVFYKKNPTKSDVVWTIGKLNEAGYQFYDSLVVVFMSHGNKTCLKVADGELHRRIDLIEPITKIGWLANKPKLFFVQACASRGSKKEGQMQDDDDEESDAEMIESGEMGERWHKYYGHKIGLEDLHPFADTLVSYATKWYDTADRGRTIGSLYINTLVDQLQKFGTKEPIQEVLQRVHYHVNMVKRSPKGEDESRPRRQAPYFESSLQKVFIFPEQ